MTSIEQIKMQLAAALADTEHAALGIAAATERLDQSIARLRLITVGSLHRQVGETINRLEQAKNLLAEAQSMVRGGTDSANEYRATI